jgi:hypothetical protein
VDKYIWKKRNPQMILWPPDQYLLGKQLGKQAQTGAVTPHVRIVS